MDREMIRRMEKVNRHPRTDHSLKIERKKNRIKEWLLNPLIEGWRIDRWGHLKKEMPLGKRNLRMKFGKQKLRLEVQWLVNGEKKWRLLKSEYYGKLTEEQLLSWPNVV